jgi:hypothetical protein
VGQHFGFAMRHEDRRRLAARLGLANAQGERGPLLEELRDLIVEVVDTRAKRFERIGGSSGGVLVARGSRHARYTTRSRADVAGGPAHARRGLAGGAATLPFRWPVAQR